MHVWFTFFLSCWAPAPTLTTTDGIESAASGDGIEEYVTRDTLPGGLTLALLPRITEGAKVHLALTIRFGSEAALKGKVAAARLLPALLLHQIQEGGAHGLKERLDALGATVEFVQDQGATRSISVVQVRVRTVHANLSPVVRLLGEWLRRPVFTKKGLATVQRSSLAEAAALLKDPIAAGSEALVRRLAPYPPDDVRHVPTIREAIVGQRKVRLAELAALHRRLWGADAAQLSVVGDFDPDELKESVGRFLAPWKSREPYRPIRLPFRNNLPGSDTIDTPDRTMAFVGAGQELRLRDDDPEYPALYLWNFLLDAGPTSRLLLRLRRFGCSASATFSRLYAHPIDRNTQFYAGAIVDPADMDRGMAALSAEIEDLLKYGVGAVELAEAKRAYAENWQKRMVEGEFLLGELNQGLFLGRTFAYWAELNRKIEGLTAAEVNAAARRFIDPTRFSKAAAGDLAKKSYGSARNLDI
jgi:zinc protease